MFKILVVGTISAFAAASDYHPVNQEIVDEIRAKATTWEPMEVHENPLASKSIEEIRGLFGVHIDPTIVKSKEEVLSQNFAAGSSFDSREEWPDCIHPIRD